MANGLLLLFVRDEVFKFPVVFEVQSKFRFIALKIENYPDMYCQTCLIQGKFRIYDLFVRALISNSIPLSRPTNGPYIQDSKLLRVFRVDRIGNRLPHFDL